MVPVKIEDEAMFIVPEVVIVPPERPRPVATEVTPLFMEELATHVGTPLESERIYPFVPAATLPKRAGVAEFEVHIAKSFATSLVDVAIGLEPGAGVPVS